MKEKLIILGLLLLSFSSPGQFMAYVTQLENSEKGPALAEVTLIHRHRTNPTDSMTKLGSATLMIPIEVDGKQLKIEHNRFRATTGSPFRLNGKAYIQVYLSYDNETTDPRDDVSIIALAFEVDEELINHELEHSKEDYADYEFADAPKGNVIYKTYSLKK